MTRITRSQRLKPQHWMLSRKYMIGKIIAIANQKGGVAKTTTAINIATSMAAIGKKTLIIDFDPQGNATTGLGVEKTNDGFNTISEALLGDADINDCIFASEIKGLSIIPADMTLSAVEIEIERTETYHFILKTAISSIKEHFDICFIDCPPSLGFLTVNALSAAHSILIPLQCEFYALEGLAHLLQTHHMITQNINHDLKIEGIVLTMYDKRNKLTEQVEDDVRSFLSTAVYNTVIPRNVKLSEAPSHGKPVLIYDVNCSGSLAYIELAKEMLAKNVLAA